MAHVLGVDLYGTDIYIYIYIYVIPGMQIDPGQQPHATAVEDLNLLGLNLSEVYKKLLLKTATLPLYPLYPGPRP